MYLGKQLKKERKKKSLSLKELSAVTNLSISFLSDIENERSNPSINNLIIICKALSIEISHLFPNNKDINKIKFEDIIALLGDFVTWDERDQHELYYYLKAKNTIINFKNNKI